MNRLIFALTTGWIILISCTYTLAQKPVVINQMKTDITGLMDMKIHLPAIEMTTKEAYAIADQYPDSAITLLWGLFQKSEMRQYNYGMAIALLSIGDIYVNRKMEMSKGLIYFRKAYPYCKKLTYRKAQMLVKWNNGMAEAFIIKDSYDSAMVYVLNALETSLPLKDKDMEEMKVILYNNIATIYRHTECERALFYLKKAKAIAVGLKEKPLLAATYINFAFLLYVKGEFKRALGFLDNAQKLHVGGKVLKRKSDMAYGAIYLQMRQPKKAIPYFKNMLVLNNRQSKLNSFCFNALGVSYASLRDYTNAERYLKLALTTTPAPRISAYARYELYNNLAVLYDSMKNYKKAYEYLILAAGENDSIKNNKRLRYINRLEMLYRTAEKDKLIKSKQLKLVSVENRLRKKNLWIESIVFSVLLLLLLLAFIFQRQRLHLQRAITTQEQKKLNQLKAITEAEERVRSRIGRQLYDDVMVEFSIVKMNLAALHVQYPEIKKIEDYKNIERQLHLANIKLRQTAHNLMPDALLEDGLVSAIHYFCNGVQKITGIQINFQHYGVIPRQSTDTEISLYRTVQELIQNVIKHASASRILIQINYRERHLTLTVEDDGIGIADAGAAFKNGMGLKSIRKRLEAIDGDMELHKRKPCGTSVNIELNI